MMRALVALLMMAGAAQADQIDYLMVCADETACIADPVIGGYHYPASPDGPGGWRGDVVIPGVQVWDTRQDVTGIDAEGAPMVTHAYLSGFWLVVSSAGANAALAGDGNLVLSANRDASLRGEAFVTFSVQPDEQLAFFQLAPLFAGSNYPFGAPK